MKGAALSPCKKCVCVEETRDHPWCAPSAPQGITPSVHTYMPRTTEGCAHPGMIGKGVEVRRCR